MTFLFISSRRTSHRSRKTIAAGVPNNLRALKALYANDLQNCEVRRGLGNATHRRHGVGRATSGMKGNLEARESAKESPESRVLRPYQLRCGDQARSARTNRKTQ